MNRIEITMNNMNYSGWLVSSLQELEEYREMTDKMFTKGVHSLIKSHEPIERWDHIAYKSEFGNLLMHALSSARAKGKSPMIELANIYDRKLMSMLDLITKGYKLLINDVGGYCYITHDNYKVVDNYVKKKYYYIRSNTKFINLENDPFLESYTMDNLSNLDKNYSYILDTQSLIKEELKSILIEFKSKGGSGIWQYTTAMAIEQLYMYIDTGIEVGLTDFVINFNSGKNIDIDELILMYEANQNINFSYSFV